MGSYWVYLLAHRPKGVIYVGVTNDLIRRVYEHRNNLVAGFSKQYNVHDLVYFEPTSDVESAIAREKQLKKWHRDWKVALIEKENPDWRDLYIELVSGGDSG